MSRILGQPVHFCYVYPNFDAALERLAAAGIGPFYVMHSGDSVTRYRGQDMPVNISVAFVYSGDACLEVISTNGPQQNAYSEFLDRNPSGGLHHVAYLSSDFEASLKTMEEQGKPLRIVQEISSEDAGGVFEIYCEPVGVDNPIMFQLLRPGLFDSWFDAMKAAADTWDGSEPIRDARVLMASAIAKSKAATSSAC